MSSFAQCVQNAVNGGMVPSGLGKKAQEDWKRISAALVAKGTPQHLAQNQAALVVVQKVQRQAQRSKWRKLATINMAQKQAAAVKGSQKLLGHLSREMELIDYEGRSLERLMFGRVSEFLKEHRPTWRGKQSNPAQMENVLKEIHGESSGDLKAQTLGKALLDVKEQLRQMLNEQGYAIGKLDSHGISHRHDRNSILKAGYPQWKADITDRTKIRLDWKRIENPDTGLPFQGAGSPPPSAADQEAFLAAIFENFEYGKQSKRASYGVSREGLGGLEARRILHFEDAGSWSAYNKLYGSTDPFNAIVEDIADMSREVAMARHFGPNSRMGAEYVAALLEKEARDRKVGSKQAAFIAGSAAHGLRVQRVMGPGQSPPGPIYRSAAQWMSTTRKMLNAAFLDRAVIVSVPSDLNSARLASQAVGMNPGNVLSTYTTLMADAVKGGGMTTDDLLRQYWIADSYANPSATMSRYQTDFPAHEWAEVLSNGAMRVQGLAAHTDNLKLAVQHSISGHLMSESNKALSSVEPDLQARMREHGITEGEWDDFRSSGGHFTAGNGASFLNPLYWRMATSLPQKDADRVFLKLQSFVESWTEKAVPSRSVRAMGLIDPKAWGLPPGTPIYELMKSGTMFKSFVGAFVMNQAHMISLQKGAWNKGAYISDLLFSSTIAGGVAIQAASLIYGRDPEDMTTPDFWARSFLKGGGGGPLADILVTGSASWGGGFPSYAAGPGLQTVQDVYNLTLDNAWEAAQDLANGEEFDVGFVKELTSFGRRYMPMAQTPALGPAIDRLVWDQLQLFLDPESVDAMAEDAQRRQEKGSGYFWMPGHVAPGRGPDMATAIGR